jgi:DNA-binding PucR family transcriptional regulator
LTLALVQRGALPAGRPTRTSDHLETVILLQDDELAAALVSERLAALDALPPADRDRLTETLAAWLANQRHTPQIAAQLQIHPQTVRYRIGQLRELLGDSLDTPDGRFGLELALRAQRAGRGSGAGA